MFSTYRDVARRNAPLPVCRAAGEHPDDSQPVWIHLPIAEAQLLSPQLELTTYCETVSHQGKRRIATTFHAVINVPGEPDRAWLACAECTRLMMDGADPPCA
jgi:hypothetical protein